MIDNKTIIENLENIYFSYVLMKCKIDFKLYFNRNVNLIQRLICFPLFCYFETDHSLA